MLKFLKKLFGETVYMKSFDESDKNDFAEQWKKYGELNKRLVDGIIYSATIELVKSERDKEIIERVSKMQNEILEGFYIERLNKIKNKMIETD